MTLASLDQVAREFGGETLFAGVSLRVEAKDRIGVIGDNGAGKTTLLRILVGQDEPDHGQRQIRRNLRIAYAAQIPELRAGTTALQFVLHGTGEHPRLETRIRDLEQAMAAHADAAQLAEYGQLQGAFEAGGGYQRQSLCERVMGGLGFAGSMFGVDVAVMSGGERARLVLSTLMTAPADLLVLDEPTNHLDIEGIEFLEEFLGRYPGAAVVVSHDRHFLDRFAESIVVVEAGEVQRYKGNYTAYRRQRDERLLTQARAWRDQQAMLEREMDYIRRNMGSRMTAQAKGRLKRLQRVELLQRPRGPRDKLTLQLAGGRGLSGQAVLEAEDLGVRLPDGRELFRGARFRLDYGETLGLLGRNGSGKTTLLRVLAGHRRADAGELRFAAGVKAGFFDQEMRDLPRSGTVLAALRAVEPLLPEKELRDHLARFWFSGDEVDLPVDSLSGGEKRRLCLARLVRAPFDYLCLDEPTNHLDVGMRESLEEALQGYSGAAVVVSHDRAFLEAVCDRVLWIEDARIAVYDGGLTQALARRSEARAAVRAAAGRQAATAKRAAPPPEATRRDGKVRNPLLFQRLEDKIIALEERLETLRADMATPESYRDVERMRTLQSQAAALQVELDESYRQWENWS